MIKFSYKDLPAYIVCAVLLALALLFDFIDLDASHLIGNAVLVVVACTLGVLLGRRSKTANEFADEAYAQAQKYADALRKHGIKIPK